MQDEADARSRRVIEAPRRGKVPPHSRSCEDAGTPVPPTSISKTWKRGTAARASHGVMRRCGIAIALVQAPRGIVCSSLIPTWASLHLSRDDVGLERTHSVPPQTFPSPESRAVRSNVRSFSARPGDHGTARSPPVDRPTGLGGRGKGLGSGLTGRLAGQGGRVLAGLRIVPCSGRGRGAPAAVNLARQLQGRSVAGSDWPGLHVQDHLHRKGTLFPSETGELAGILCRSRASRLGGRPGLARREGCRLATGLPLGGVKTHQGEGNTW